MEELIIPKIEPQKVELYNPDGVLLGSFNQYETLDIRVQIKQKKLKGYYIVFNGDKIRIDRNGNLESYPDGLFDLISEYTCKII